MTETVSIVICTRNPGRFLDAALRTAARAASRVEGRTIVIEQGGRFVDETRRRLGISAEVIPDDGEGLARARNLAVKMARSELLLFTDDDCEVPETWAESYLCAFADPQVAAAFGPVQGLARTYSDETPLGDAQIGVRVQDVYGARQSMDWECSVCSNWPLASRPWLVGHGANMAIRRTALVAIGGFDERLGAGTRARSAEDTDVVSRLLRAGATVLTDSGPAVRHREWRTPSQVRDAVLGYERGAGVWIGKELRAAPASGLVYLRARLEYLHYHHVPIGRDEDGQILPLKGRRAHRRWEKGLRRRRTLRELGKEIRSFAALARGLGMGLIMHAEEEWLNASGLGTS